MANYTINFTDPTSPTIAIPPRSVNGPGAPSADTSLRLHGDGYVNWGEAVNENLVRLMENFMGATAPVNPVTGQLWVEAQLYFRNTAAGTFYRYDIDPSSPTYKTWVAITVVSQATAPTEILGTYWFNTTDSTLRYFASAYDTQPASWMIRSFDSGTVAPTAAPNHQIKMYNASAGPAGAWSPIPAVMVTSSSDSPADARVGTLRFDPVTDILYVWTGSAWASLLDSGHLTFNGQLDMTSNKIVNVADATNPQDALNLQTADARYVNVAGDTVTGALTLSSTLTLSGNPTLPLHAAPKQYVESYAAPLAHTHMLSNITNAGTAAAVNVGTAAGEVPLTSNIVGRQTIWIPAGAMNPRGVNGASFTTTTFATSSLTLKTLSFDPAVSEYAWFSIRMPKSWNESTVNVQVAWEVTAGSGSGVVWGVSASALADGESLSTLPGTVSYVADSAPSYSTLYVTNEFTVTVANLSQEQELVTFQIARNVSDVADVHTGDANLVGVTIFYNTNALNDA